MDIADFKNKNVSIRSRDYPHFELINGILNECLGDFEYTVEFGRSRYSFDSILIKEVINNTLFI